MSGNNRLYKLMSVLIFGAMVFFLTSMESTLKLRVGEFLLTGVIFGNSIYRIDQDANIDIKGKDILLFDRRSGKLISAGALEIM